MIDSGAEGQHDDDNNKKQHLNMQASNDSDDSEEYFDAEDSTPNRLLK